MHRHVQDCGLSRKYNEDRGFRFRVSRLGALAFLPPDDVPDAFERLSIEFEAEEQAFLKYFEKTWVGELPRRGGQRKAPAFPRQMWSVHHRALEQKFLTNNNAEVFHGNYRTHLVQGKHPSMPTFVEGLQAQQRLLNNDMTQIGMGAHRAERPQTVTRTTRSKNLCEVYVQGGDAIDLLAGVANLYLQT